MRKYIVAATFVLSSVAILVAQNNKEEVTQQIKPWNNPSYATFGKATSRPEIISYTARPMAEKGDRNQAPHFLPLQGKWRANFATTTAGVKADFFNPKVSVASFSETIVPNNSVTSGASPLSTLYPPLLPNENPLVQYRAEIDVPYMWLDRDMFIHIEGVGGAYTLYVNNERIGYSEDSHTPAEYEISKAIVDGLNSISIEVVGFSTGSWMETLTPQFVAGSLGNVYIFSQPKLRIDDFTVSAKADTVKPNGRIDIAVVMSNSYRGPEEITLGYDIYSPQGKLLTYNLQERIIGSESKDTIRVHEIINGAMLNSTWSPEEPNLYKMMLYVRRDGRIIEYIPIRIGFNQNEVRDGVLLLNGKTVKLEPARYNAAPTVATTKRELQSLKSKKINTIYVDYPQPSWFYELCDEIGLYVVDQANINGGFRNNDRNVGGTITNDRDYLPAFIDRAMTMQGRSKNYTSIIALSLGGEIGNGYNAYKTYQWLKSTDTLHPIVFKGAAREWNSDLTLPAAKDADELLKSITPAKTSR